MGLQFQPPTPKFEKVRNQVVINAVRSMLYEASTAPKPGLVDPINSGPHPDMDFYMFIDSTTSLQNYFQEVFVAGWLFQKANYRELFSQIRTNGMNAEETMFAVTGGVNTHKGAIFSLGVLVCATGVVLSHGDFNLTAVVDVVKKMLTGLTENDFRNVHNKAPQELTAGERQYLRYGETGIRGEAEKGYPTVIEVALPFLLQARGIRNQRLLDTLMVIVKASNDSNLIKRAGNREIITWAHQQAQEFLDFGGSRTTEGMTKLRELNEMFLQKNLSLGGSADLLIITIYLALMLEKL